MSTTTVSETIARPVRGLAQGGAGWLLTECIDAFNIYDFDDRQYGLSVIVLGTVVSFIQNTIESRTGKAFLRRATVTEVPVTNS